MKLSKVNGLIAIAGHSLGGPTAQFVAQWLETQQVGQENRDRLRAIAFNAAGIVPSRGPDPVTLWSFHMAGDPLVVFGYRHCRIQGGRVIQYIPATRPTRSGRLENRGDAVTLEQHWLSAVQKGLCDCMKGEGDLNVQERVAAQEDAETCR